MSEFRYLIYTSGGSCGTTIRRTTSSGTSSPTRTGTFGTSYSATGVSWNRGETARSIQSGTWQVRIWAANPFGSATIWARIQHVNSSCVVQSTLLEKSASVSGASYSLKTLSNNPGQVDFSAGDRIVVSLKCDSGFPSFQYNSASRNSLYLSPDELTSTAWEKECSEGIDVEDTYERGIYRVLSEVTDVADVVSKGTHRILSEVTDVADTVRKGVGKVLTEAPFVVERLKNRMPRWRIVTATTDYLSPISDIQAGFDYGDSPHADCINTGGDTPDPVLPDDADNSNSISAKGWAGDHDRYEMETPVTGIGTVDQISIRVWYHSIYWHEADQAQLKVGYYLDGVLQDEQTHPGLTPWWDVGDYGPKVWYLATFDWSGLSISEADMANFQIGLTTVWSTTNPILLISDLRADVIGTGGGLPAILRAIFPYRLGTTHNDSQTRFKFITPSHTSSRVSAAVENQAAEIPVEQVTILGGAISPPDFEELDNADAGLEEFTYGEIYNRIWVIPRYMRVQNPTLGVDIPFSIWQAFPTQNNMSSIGGSGQTGLTLDLSAPRMFGILEELEVNLQVGASAPNEVSATYLFNFDD